MINYWKHLITSSYEWFPLLNSVLPHRNRADYGTLFLTEYLFNNERILTSLNYQIAYNISLPFVESKSFPDFYINFLHINTIVYIYLSNHNCIHEQLTTLLLAQFTRYWAGIELWILSTYCCDTTKFNIIVVGFTVVVRISETRW